MAPTSSFIYEQLRDLKTNMDHFSRIRDELCHYKSIVQNQADLIHKVLNSSSNDLLNPSADSADILPPTLDQDIWELRSTIHRFNRWTAPQLDIAQEEEAEEPQLDIAQEKVRHVKDVVESGCAFLHKEKLSATVGGAKAVQILQTTPRFMYRQIQVLVEKMDLFLQAEEIVDKMRLKFSVEDHIELMAIVLKEAGHLVNGDVEDDAGGRFDDQETWSIREKMHLFLFEARLNREKGHHIKCTVEDGFDYLEKRRLGPLAIDLGGAKAEPPRHLLVSNGRVVRLLDLKKASSTLPVVATLNLIEEQPPVSMGLLRLGSDAYMIGGHMFPTVNPGYAPIPSGFGSWGCKCLLMSRGPLKGTSRATYRLTLGEDGKTLSPSSQSDIKEMHSPKFWPIVEEIDSQKHVFDSDPGGRYGPSYDGGCMFSHEVLECDGWSEIPTDNLAMHHGFIRRHLVLGHHMYAIVDQTCLLFDSREKKWELVADRTSDHSAHDAWSNRLNVKCVWDILFLPGFAWNVGEIGLGNDQLYVILALEHALNRGDYMIAKAYLVNSTTGQVVRFQFLHNFFSTDFEPRYIRSGTVIKAGDDLDGNTMCAILNASAGNYRAGKLDWCLFIYTFTVKELSGAASKFKANQQAGFGPFPDFVRVDVKESYIFRANAEFVDEKAGGYFPNCVGIQACFVDGNDGRVCLTKA